MTRTNIQNLIWTATQTQALMTVPTIPTIPMLAAQNTPDRQRCHPMA